MFEQYKTDSFPTEKLNQITERLQSKGWEVETKWKKGVKTTEDINEANLFELRINGKLVLKQQGKAGTVRMGKITEEQKSTFLKVLKSHGLYTEPNWVLGVVLTAAYFILLFVAMANAQEKIVKIVLPIAMVAMICFIGIALMKAKQIIPDGANILVWIIGIPAVMLSAPASVLNIPLIHTIYKYGLFNRVNPIEKSSA